MKTTDLWIDGNWVPASRSEELKYPETGEVIGHIGYASPAQAEQAIEAAATAFESFRHTPAYARADILYKVADALMTKHEEAARLIAVEAGKPIRAARTEMDRTIQTYRFAAEAAKQIGAHTIPMDAAPRGEHYIAYTKRIPLGVVSAITPFNFPFNLVAHKVGPAIAAGNTIVLKPAEQTPLSALFLSDIFRDAGLPSGVLNIIPGSGAELSEMLTTHPKVSFITFTGSPRVGKIIRAQAGLRKVTLELGSNSPLLVDHGLTEAELDAVVDMTVSGGFSYNGQVCISIQRIYVHQEMYEPFLQKLAQRVQTLKIGDPLQEDTDISALINPAAVERLKAWCAHAIEEGARVYVGGQFHGNVMEPTIFTDVPKQVEINCEEAFGPLVTVTPFMDWMDAVGMANQSKFGLNAGLFTKDLERAMYAAEHLECGGVLVNQIPTFRVDQMPYGGIKESGSGREGVMYAMEDMMDIKFIGIRTGVFPVNTTQ